MRGGFFYGVRCYAGLPGSGKTYSMALDAWGEYRRGHKVISNCLNFGETLDNVDGLINATDALVVIDEANLWLPARAWAKIPMSLLWKLGQVRKFGLKLWYSTQNIKRVDTVLREITFEYYNMRSFCRLGFFLCKVCDNSLKFQTWEIRRFSASLAERLYGTHSLVAIPAWLAGKGGIPQVSARLSPWEQLVASMGQRNPAQLARYGIV